jgi:hypothetical protein
MNTNKVNQNLVGKKYNEIIPLLEIIEDGGDCCGYSSCEEPSKETIDILAKINPVLIDCVQIDYEDEYQSRTVINFVFQDSDNYWILGYDLKAGSGSGWTYGAYVKIMLEGQNLGEASW